MNNVVGVVFDNGNKLYNFINYIENLKVNDLVIVDTENGLQNAKVKILYSNCKKEPLKEVVRKITKKDISKIEKNEKDALKASENCKKIVDEMNLKMRIVDAVYNFERTQLTFHFLADKRIDFRQLVKKLASIYKTRIELRQIGVRDKAKEVGGVGICGRQLCCASHLKNFNSVSINMAKNQNISLNPNKINGGCGRLLCCLRYENECYEKCKKELPKKGEIIDTPKGKGEVVSCDLLNGSYSVKLKNKDVINIEADNC